MMRYGLSGVLSASITSAGNQVLGAGRVVGRRASRQPVPKRVRLVGQPPLLEDRQRHRPKAPFTGPGRETLLLQPLLEGLGRGVGSNRALQQVLLHRQTDCVRRGVALAALAPPLGGGEGGQQLAADLTGATHARRASSAYPGRSGRR